MGNLTGKAFPGVRNLTFNWVGSVAYGGVGKIEPEMSGFIFFFFLGGGDRRSR